VEKTRRIMKQFIRVNTKHIFFLFLPFGHIRNKFNILLNRPKINIRIIKGKNINNKSKRNLTEEQLCKLFYFLWNISIQSFSLRSFPIKIVYYLEIHWESLKQNKEFYFYNCIRRWWPRLFNCFFYNISNKYNCFSKF